jgi:hypothetical protein
VRPAPLLLLWLAACAEEQSPRPQPVADPGAYAMLLRPGGQAAPYKGAIIGGEWIWDTPGAAGWAAVALPVPEREEKARRYRLRRVELKIEPGACANPELRRTLPDRVTVSDETGPVDGCGGPRQVPAQVAGTHWQVLRLGRSPAPGQGAPTIFTFAAGGGLGGTLACNDVGIGARWTEEGFEQPGGDRWIEGTAVGCEGPDVQFGQRFWDAMYRATSWQRRGDRLRIVFSDGSDAELRLIL